MFLWEEAGWQKVAGVHRSPEQKRPNVIFLHGQSITQNGIPLRGQDALAEFAPLAEALAASEQYEHVLGFGYDPDQSLEDLARAFEEKSASCPKMDVIAYSMGGLVARFALEQGELKAGRLITLATPHLGIEISEEVRRLIAAAPFLALLDPSMKPLVDSVLAMNQLFSGSQAMTKLNSAPVSGSHRYLVLQGETQKPVPEIPVSSLLMGIVYKGKKSDGIVPVYSAGDLQKVLPEARVETFSGFHHNVFKSESFATILLEMLKPEEAPADPKEVEKPEQAEEKAKNVLVYKDNN